MKTGIFFIITLIVCTDIFDTVSQLCVKSAINHLDRHVNSLKKAVSFLFSLLRKKRLLISLISSTASFSVWLFVLSKIDLNLAYSIDSMRYVFIAVASLVFLKERIGVLRWLGITSVFLGIMMVTLI
jgi:multidrug transporter EmrE-like cation transporter